MSKELDVFNEIIDKFAEQMMRANKESLTTINKTNAIEYLYRTPQVILLQEALQRLKSIENSNPSEALECLEDLRQECKSTYFDENGKQWWTTDKNKDYRCNTIEQSLLKSQEQNMKYNEINKTFSDSHICEIKKEFTKYNSLCEESKCDECPLGVGDGICLKNTFEKKWELQIKAQEQEKVLEIIKNKFVDIQRLMKCINVATYNNGLPKNRQLTQEEFDLLKEVLGE